MKTIEEILTRNDYTRLTSALKERVEEIAKHIRLKIKDLDLENDEDFYEGEIGKNDVVVAVKSVKSNGLGIYEFLAIKDEQDEEGNYNWLSLEDICKEYYYCGDFTAPVHGATRKDALRFLNVARLLLEGLDEIETKEESNIKEAIEDTTKLNIIKIKTSKYNEVRLSDVQKYIKVPAQIIKPSCTNGVYIGTITYDNGQTERIFSDYAVRINNVHLPFAAGESAYFDSEIEINI